MANRFCGCFVWALAPFFVLFWCFAVCFAVSSSGETQVWLGDLRVVVFGWLLFFFVCCFNRFAASMGLICPCTNVFPAYAHVRTEPLARHRPHSRKKKSPLSLLWFCVPFGASPFWALGFPVSCFRLCVSCFPLFLLCSFVGVGGSRIFWLGDWLLLAPLPVCCHLPFPLGWSRGAPWSSFHAGTSLWVSGCSCDGSVALPLCWECGCALSSFLHFVSWQQRLLSPVWGCYHPLHHVAGAVRMLSLTRLRYSSG